MTDWRDLPSGTLERHFNPRASVPDFEQWFARFIDWSATARPALGGTLDVRYGPGRLMTADIHPGRGPDAPILVFVHGGYWRALDKREQSFVLAPFVAAGATAVNLNYDLCPAVTVADIVGEVRAAVAWVRREPAVPGDRTKLHLAGAHLVAMCLNHDWARDGLPATPIASATLISGIYDLDPVLHVSVNADIRLDGPMARAQSPLRHPPTIRCPTLIAVGEAEPEGWIAQSSDYHAACRAAGIAADYWRLADEHHFSILKLFTDPHHPLVMAIKRRMGL
jgi:arylformamidase